MKDNMLPRSSVIAAAMFFASAIPALAGPLDVPQAEPPAIVPVQAQTQDGFGGFYGALEFGTVDGSISSGAVLPFDEGTALGLVGGYNWQSGAFILGGELRVLRAEGLNAPTGDAYRTIYDLRGRAGYAMGNFMAYGAVGFSQGTVLPGTPTEFDSDGMNFGIGVEYNISEQFFLGADLTRRDLSGSSPLTTFDLEADTLSLRGGFRF